jgi:hypothetical protein
MRLQPASVVRGLLAGLAVFAVGAGGLVRRPEEIILIITGSILTGLPAICMEEKKILDSAHIGK